jgi:transposase-like protein
MSKGYGIRELGRNRKHTGEFKLAVIKDLRDNKLAYREVGQKYKISDSTILKWERIFLEEGPEGLFVERRGRSSNSDSVNKGRPKKLDKQTEEDLIAEVQRLRMENAYLKKLNALVHEREKSKKPTRLK